MLTDMNTTLELTEGAASNDPDTGLRAVAALRTLTDRLELLQVENARRIGWSWQDIASRLGVTKPGAAGDRGAGAPPGPGARP